MNYTINTKISINGIIDQTLVCTTKDCTEVSQISREITDTKEAQVHEALIKLGWTPPVEDKKTIVTINLVKEYRNIRGLGITYCDLCVLSMEKTSYSRQLCNTCSGTLYYKIGSIDGDFKLNII